MPNATAQLGRRTIENGRVIVTYTREEIAQLPDESDWARVDAMTDEEIEELAKNNPDEEGFSEDLSDAVLVVPKGA